MNPSQKCLPHCPEIPSANGQGETIEEVKESLKPLADIRRGLPKEAIEETISIP